MGIKEVVTLQFGNYTNYVAAHWWDLQEFSFNYGSNSLQSEIDHDVLYREGLNRQGYVTFTPRLLLVDLQGSLMAFPKSGGLYETNLANSDNSENLSSLENLRETVCWEPDKVDVVEKETDFVKDSTNPQIEKLKQSWSDFLYTRFHPRTIHTVDHQFSHEKDCFDTFSLGVQTWNSDKFREEFIDNLRKYLEECNNCQGFQILFDAANGFSGMAASCLEYLKDEYGKTNFAIPIFSTKSVNFKNADSRVSHGIRLVNIATAYSNLIEHANLFVPLSIKRNVINQSITTRQFKNLTYDRDNLYQTSAILASYLETVSFPYRLKNIFSSTDLQEFCNYVNHYGRTMAAASISLPFEMRENYDLIDTLNEVEAPFFENLSPNSTIGTDYIVQTVSVRGIPKVRLKRPLHEAKQQMKMAAYKCDSVSEMFQLYFQCSNYASMAKVTSIELPIKIREPFPVEIFNTNLNSNGFINDMQRSFGTNLNSFPCVASIQNSAALMKTIADLQTEAARIKIGKIHRFRESGMEMDQYEEVLESLSTFKNRYNDSIEI